MPDPLDNRLLARLPPASFERIAPALNPVDLPLHAVLIRPGVEIERVIFPTAGLSSDIAMVTVDRGVECGMAGTDGLIGLPVILGLDRGIHTSVMQVAGAGYQIKSSLLRQALDRDDVLRGVLLSYLHVFLAQASQSAACNARHPVEQRLARWLLMAADRTEETDVPLTHQYLSLMLGIRRAGVTVAIHVLEGEGLIKSERGRTLIRDRTGLERRVCACYRLVRDEAARVFNAVPVEA